MVLVIYLRGASAVGKTTIAKKVLLELKIVYKIDCAYFCEDNFRKEMQFKYKAKDLKVHLNSVELIKTGIEKLLQLDSYELIIIEGQFRYQQVLQRYEQFLSQKQWKYLIFQLEVDLEEMERRDRECRPTKSPNMEEVKRDIDAFTPENTIIINTLKPIEITSKEILDRILKEKRINKSRK